MLARRISIGLGVSLAALLLGGWFYVRSITPQLDLGVGYAARVACGCRYIEGRPLARCRDDFDAGMAPIRLTDHPAMRAVTAYVPFVTRRTARFDATLGCQPEPFAGTPLTVR